MIEAVRTSSHKACLYPGMRVKRRMMIYQPYYLSRVKISPTLQPYYLIELHIIREPQSDARPAHSLLSLVVRTDGLCLERNRVLCTNIFI